MVLGKAESYPLRQVELSGAVEAEDGVEVPGRPVEVVLAGRQIVGVAELLDA